MASTLGIGLPTGVDTCFCAVNCCCQVVTEGVQSVRVSEDTVSP